MAAKRKAGRSAERMSKTRKIEETDTERDEDTAQSVVEETELDEPLCLENTNTKVSAPISQEASLGNDEDPFAHAGNESTVSTELLKSSKTGLDAEPSRVPPLIWPEINTDDASGASKVPPAREPAEDSDGDSISSLPLDLQFGRLDSFFDMRNFLVDKRNSAVKIFISGFVISADFRNTEGMPLRPSRIYNEYTVPGERTTKDSFLNIQAGRWQTSYGAPRESPGNPFTGCYLADRSLRDRSPYSVESIGRGDLVVLETRLRSRRTEREGRTVEFQLQAVNLLMPKARHIETAVSNDGADVDW
ncbi:hypothetical protein CALCODRAFT_507541 [Calocera cornea HHB12733]|uniref:Uncharacterized protein n=1 Tax=Calocera cornea HHB12733 TaxID=1353952 RepID=A0A165HHZ3_9BASI|nr:hypothetical protein CALCODRAFT_507541 [Calocera cornea HHB12733]